MTQTLFQCFFGSRPYYTDFGFEKKPKLKHQVHINIDHPPMTIPEVLTGSNFSNDYKDSQIIEPIINTITDAMKYTFYDYNDPNVYNSPNYRQRFLWRDFFYKKWFKIMA